MANNKMDQEVVARDYAKWVWLGIFIMFALMVGAMLFFGENKDSSRSMVRARHILVKFDPSNPSERQQMLNLISELRTRILGGEEFAKLAREYSNDEGSAARGGDLGNQAKGVFEPEFEKTAWSLPIGELSEVIVSPNGFHIVEVLERSLSKMDSYQQEIEEKADELLHP